MIAEKDRRNTTSEMKTLSLEVAEIKEISDIIFRRIENKIEMLSTLETSVDRKIASLEQLLRQADQVKAPVHAPNAPANGMSRQQQVVALQQRGLKAAEIARTLCMPVGEVELILGLYIQKA